jgi:N-acetylmuramoyl-L-alanine amidase
MKKIPAKEVIIILVSLSIITAYVPSSWASPREDLKKFEQQVALLKKSKKEKKDRANWLRCARDFKKIIKKYPKSSYAAKAFLNLGNLYYDIYLSFDKKEDLDEALRNYSALIEKYPKSRYTPEAHYRKGEIYLVDLKDQLRASQEFENLVIKYPKTEFSRKASERLSEIEAEKKKERVVTVKDMRHHSTKKHTRVVVDLDGPIKYEYHRIKAPDRLYFDLKNSRISEELQKKALPIDDGILKAVRINQFSPEIVRVVLDLDSIESFKAFPMENPDRLVIDISGISKLEPPIPKEVPFYGIRRIVIDPGHGGHDPGAIGKKGLKEKDVVLDIAKRLKKLIEKEMDVEVILTRDRDVFIRLEDRTAIAIMKEADLFLSIHVNASPNRNARGIETYFLNFTDEEDANKVAARENAISLKRQRELQREFLSDFDKIQGDLKSDYKRDESLRLAHMVQNSMVERLKLSYNVSNLGVKWAFFYVLVGAKMPSILTEVSFISNSEEEKRLRDNVYREKIAEGILYGIKDYLSYKNMVSRGGS